MFMDRVLGVFRLDPAVFEAIEHDQGATSQALLVVAIVALMRALGSGFQATWTDASFLGNFIGALIWTFAGWLVWSVISYWVGTAFFRGVADLGEMLRVIGFAYAPQFLAIIPCVGFLVGVVWSLAAGFVAIRQGLDLDNVRALFTILAGLLVYVIGSLLISAFFGGLGMIFG
jgi:hypothetical protein